MSEVRLDETQVLGGKAKVYRRVPGGTFHVYLWLSKEKKRFRRALDTPDLTEAVRKAEEVLLDVLKRQSLGQKVLSASLGEVVDAWEGKHRDRLARGELRSSKSFENHTRFFRKHLDALYGLNTPVSRLTQGESVNGEPAPFDWDRFVPYRLAQGVALDTVRGEASYFRSLVQQVGVKLGASVVPEFKVFVPKHLKARRRETFTREEFHEVRRASHRYPVPDAEDGKTYLRGWALNKGPDKRPPTRLDQGLEFTRRVLLRHFVEVAAFSGCRPHELAGEESSALRWRDVRFQELKVVSTELNKTPTTHTVALLHVRGETKTGERTVPTLCGKQLQTLRGWTKYGAPDDFVFADQTGTNAGSPVYLDALRQHWRELLDNRVGFTRFKADLYTLRHYFATERLAAGVEPFKVAKLLGHSLQELERTYAHLLTSEERFVRSVWKETTPKQLVELGVVVVDPDELN